MNGPIRAGTGCMTITPPLGTPMAGYFAPRYADDVLDDLRAQALALEGDDSAAIVVACDLISLDAAVTDHIRDEISRQTGVPREAVVIACTHTHTGPTTGMPWADWHNDKYLALLPELIASAGVMACRHREPATVSVAAGSAPHLVFNRRFHMKDGTVRTNPGVLNPDIVRPAGPTDPGVRVLRVNSPDGALLAVVVNYALHLDTHGGSAVSADFPYFLRETVRAELQSDVPTLFLNGTCGDINHIDVTREPVKGRENARRIGTSLAYEVLRVLPEAKPVAQPAVLRAASRRLTCGVRLPSEEEQKHAREVLGENWRDLDSCYVEVKDAQGQTRRVLNTERHHLRESLLLVDSGVRELRVELSALRLGNVGLAGIPGEVFVELGLAIQAASPFDPTLVVELANGSAGYIATRKAYDEGGYEVTLRRWACIEPGAGERIVEESVALLQGLG